MTTTTTEEAATVVSAGHHVALDMGAHQRKASAGPAGSGVERRVDRAAVERRSLPGHRDGRPEPHPVGGRTRDAKLQRGVAVVDLDLDPVVRFRGEHPEEVLD